LQKHDPHAAIQVLEASRPYDQCSALALAPAYYRGLAYLAAGHPDKATAEYRSVIARHDLVPDSPYVPLAMLQLSRALRRTGDTDGAAKAERQLKEAWRHADVGFLPLHQQ
jgi:TolA-binding protein